MRLLSFLALPLVFPFHIEEDQGWGTYGPADVGLEFSLAPANVQG